MERSHRTRLNYSPIPLIAHPELRSLKIPGGTMSVPPVLAFLIFLILLAFGFFDNFLLHSEIPRTGSMPIPVHKASLEIQRDGIKPQQVVFIEHRIVRGETCAFISYQYGLSPSTLISVNSLQHPDSLQPGGVLIIPYRDGIRVEPRRNESIQAVADRLDVETDSVQMLPNGDFFIAGAAYTDDMPSSLMDSMFRYPLVGRVIAPYGDGVDELTGIGYSSDGIDLAAIPGTPITAARQGDVILTGHHSSYGIYVIMEHQKGWRSFYGHLGRADVAPGDTLEAGTVLGTTGKSGIARTPRLHFALIHNGQTVDPLKYLY